MNHELRVGFTDWIGYAPFRLAQDLGYFDNQGIKLFFNIPSSQRYRMFQEGELDCTGSSLPGLCTQMAESGSIIDEHIHVLLAIVQSEQPGTERIVVKSCYETLQEISSGTICYVKHGLEHWYWRYFFGEAGIPFPMKVIEVSTRHQMYDCFDSAEADGVILYEPYLSYFTGNGRFHSISTSADLSIIYALLVAKQYSVNMKENQLRILINGYFKALDYLNLNPTEALTILFRYFRVDIRAPHDSLRQRLVGVKWLGRGENQVLLVENERGVCNAIRSTLQVWNRIDDISSIDPNTITVTPSFVV